MNTGSTLNLFKYDDIPSINPEENSITVKQDKYYFQHENPGYLQISGPDRLDFLQRQTTNDLRLLSPGHSLVTVLTSPAGRIQDVLWVFDKDDAAYGVITLTGQGDQTTRFLRSRIFFMDDVSVDDRSDAFYQIDLFGDGIATALKDLGADRESGENRITRIKVDEVTAQLIQHPHFAPRILFPRPDREQVISVLEGMDYISLDRQGYHITLIEAGIPSVGHELIEDYTPLEVGYEWAISDNKGCYTGQEVIARQLSYDKVTKHLVGLSLANSSEAGLTLYSTDKDQPVGKITSTGISSRFGYIALAIVKRPYHQPGTGLHIHENDNQIEAEVRELPFHQ